MTIGLFVNTNKNNFEKTALDFAGVLTGYGLNVLMSSYPDKLKNFKTVSQNQLCEQSDIILTLGGDGTILKIIAQASLNNKPVLGINLGNLGFLTDTELTDINKTAERIAAGKFKVEKRILLNVNYKNNNYLSLNEMVISRGNRTKLVPSEVLLDGIFMDEYYSDGILICTPTGSTAYNLSAGGPVLAPDVKAFVINGICAHSLHHRPVVVSADKKITVKTHYAPATLMIDGENISELEPDSDVIVSCSEIQAQFIRISEANYYKRLIEKLNRRK